MYHFAQLGKVGFGPRGIVFVRNANTQLAISLGGFSVATEMTPSFMDIYRCPDVLVPCASQAP